MVAVYFINDILYVELGRAVHLDSESMTGNFETNLIDIQA